LNNKQLEVAPLSARPQSVTVVQYRNVRTSDALIYRKYRWAYIVSISIYRIVSSVGRLNIDCFRYIVTSNSCSSGSILYS